MSFSSSGREALLCPIMLGSLAIRLLYVSPSIHLVGVVLLGKAFAKVFAQFREDEGAQIFLCSLRIVSYLLQATPLTAVFQYQ